MTQSKTKTVLQKNMNTLLISPKGTNIPGSYRECQKANCFRLIPCPHIRCQDHRTDMATQDWVVEHVEP